MGALRPSNKPAAEAAARQEAEAARLEAERKEQAALQKSIAEDAQSRAIRPTLQLATNTYRRMFARDLQARASS